MRRGGGVRLLYCVECGCCSDALGKGWVALRCDVPDRDEPDGNRAPAVAKNTPPPAQHASSAIGPKPQRGKPRAMEPPRTFSVTMVGPGMVAVLAASRPAHTLTSAVAFPSGRHRDGGKRLMRGAPEGETPKGLRHAGQSVFRLAHRCDGSTAPDIAATKDRSLAGSRPAAFFPMWQALLREHAPCGRRQALTEAALNRLGLPPRRCSGVGHGEFESSAPSAREAERTGGYPIAWWRSGRLVDEDVDVVADRLRSMSCRRFVPLVSAKRRFPAPTMTG